MLSPADRAKLSSFRVEAEYADYCPLCASWHRPSEQHNDISPAMLQEMPDPEEPDPTYINDDCPEPDGNRLVDDKSMTQHVLAMHVIGCCPWCGLEI